MQNFLIKHHIRDKVLAVAVSGGADSLALALQAQEQLVLYGYKIIALTVNHGLRPSASKEAEYVAQIMQKFNIEHHILIWQGEKPDSGIEEAARSARYSLIKDWCDKHNVGVLLVAHHLRDQAETFFMRLQRGSGLSGLCSMREVSNYENLKILRPLLKTNPKVLKDYLRNKNIEWIEDESNQNTKYLRNKIRKFLPMIAENTGITLERIDEATTNLQSADDFIESYVDALFGREIKQYGTDVFGILYADYLKWHSEIKFRVLAKLCQKQYIPRADSIMMAIKALNVLPFSGLTLGGKEIFTAYGKVWIVPEMCSKRKSSRLEWKKFAEQNPQYKNVKIPHKARLALLKIKEER
ncbi:MAG: tRNA lysidine(34) synthetase TilS [Alphaproteobacteria bacterium]|nr:tRNA lysidine(34) synthetase TilS [Alphaproteobacteria bacterium]